MNYFFLKKTILYLSFFLFLSLSKTNMNEDLQDYSFYKTVFQDVHAEHVQYDYLNLETQRYFRHTTSTVVYMSVCLSCTVWQVLTAAELAYKVRKWLHFAVFFETVLSFVSILCSVLNPLTSLSCEFVRLFFF